MVALHGCALDVAARGNVADVVVFDDSTIIDLATPGHVLRGSGPSEP